MSVPLLIADVPVGTIIFITLVIISIVSQMLAKLREAQKAPPRPPVRPASPGDPLTNEITEFLERAQQRRKSPRPPPMPATPTVRPSRPVNSGREPLEAIVVETAAPGSNVADHVSSFMGERKRGPVGSELGKEVSQSDEHLEQRLHSVFDHRLGNLSGTPGETAGAQRVDESTAAAESVEPTAPGALAGLVAMLSNPAGMRQAVLVSEILRRPEQRWG